MTREVWGELSRGRQWSGRVREEEGTKRLWSPEWTGLTRQFQKVNLEINQG